MAERVLFRQKLLLFVLFRIQGDRTLRSAYHLLTGKKTAQTIQDGKLYQTLFLFQSLPGYSEREFNQDVHDLAFQQKYIVLSQDSGTLTSKGKEKVNELVSHPPWSNHYNGWLYEKAASILWQRLSLFVQALSFGLKKDSYYIPVTNNHDVLTWVKEEWKRKPDKEASAETLFQELHKLLCTLEKLDSDIFVSRLSGWKAPGLTFGQCASTFDIESSEARFRFNGVLHYLIKEGSARPWSYPFLYSIIKDIENSQGLTATALKTKELLLQKKSKEEISVIRGLRPSTIEDHIVEISSHDPSFLIDTYVSEQLQKEIVQASMRRQTKKLKIIKEEVGAGVTYFQIRLALAQGERHGI
ncbi:helix-turn-helix domain-containing protein [Bacillus sp. FJAT-44742]|uniref:helix-turn-helix domain-containing protein n=1 Tax=Bacillus sp. FJAT-44742 TaxID=2014005 RepID=UPI0012FF32F8|nr:helix-turn-helix domain-containing protein [Bacillus sp. FJAT-44742]